MGLKCLRERHLESEPGILCLSMQEPLHPCQVHPEEPTPRETLALEGKGLSRTKRITSCLWEDGSTLNSAAAQPAGTHRHCILHCWTSEVLEPKLSQEKGNAIKYCVSIQHYALSFNVLQIKGEVLHSIEYHDVLRQGK